MRYEKEYIKILKDELIPVNGCTEPVSIAYAASLAKKYLNEDVLSVEIVSVNFQNEIYGINNKKDK